VLNDAELIAAARERAAGDSVILTFANSLYADVLMNWLVALSLQSIDNYLVIALDRELHASLTDRGIPSLLCELKSDLGDLWIQRVRVFATLCDAGVDFVHSDADAVWLRDPKLYFADAEVDLVASQGTVWPPDVHRQFGFVLCCGLFHLRSTPVSRQLLTELEQRRDRGAAMPELVAAAPDELLNAVGYYGPAGPAPAAFARLSAGLDETVVRIITARPGLEPVRAALNALTPALIRDAAGA